ncbi:MAG: hypothetical protein ACR2H2_09855 [Solirubrobacteraceae bacterium]
MPRGSQPVAGEPLALLSPAPPAARLQAGEHAQHGAAGMVELLGQELDEHFTQRPDP